MISRLFGIGKKDSEPGESSTLLVGLGNPGRKYHDNRHNIGFMVIDSLAEELDILVGRYQSQALVGSGRVYNRKLILAKPQTYMNMSGEPTGSLVRFYKIALPNLFVIYDDLDLPFGTIRLKPSGGAGGHNGMSSIIKRLGTQEFPRLRFGIGRPPGRMDPASYVLQNFSRNEQDFLKPVLASCVDAVKVYLQSGLETAMNQFNSPEKKV